MLPESEAVSQKTLQNNFGYKLASPWIRLGASLVEGVLIFLPLYFILGNDISFYNDDLFSIESTLFQSAISGILGAFFYTRWSGNLGHRLLGLKVISAVDGSDQRKASQGALREILKNILSIALIPIIWLIWDSKTQNLYDKITKTLVVYS